MTEDWRKLCESETNEFESDVMKLAVDFESAVDQIKRLLYIMRIMEVAENNSLAAERIGIEVLTDQLTDEVQRHAKTIVEMGRYKSALEQIATEPTTKYRIGDHTYWLNNARSIARKALSPSGEQEEDGE